MGTHAPGALSRSRLYKFQPLFREFLRVPQHLTHSLLNSNSNMRLSALLAPAFALFFACVGGAPTTPDLSGLSIGDIINALQIGLVADINAFITVCWQTCSASLFNFLSLSWIL